jgi:hypothetical protein
MRPSAILVALSLIFLGLGISPKAAEATSNIQVSVFNMPLLNGSGCNGENDNLISIINRIPGYTVDGSIVDFIDGAGQPTVASQLAASRFFFMTDMESGSADPNSSSFLPESAKSAFRSWTNSGGVMVMTGTSGAKDVQFLNNIYGWNLGNTSGASASEVTANTAGTPFANASGGRALGTPSATDSISAGTVSNFTKMWVNASGNSAVAVIKYGAGYVIYMGWDFYDSGYGCGQYNNDWVQGIVPAALDYASELSQSGLENATTSGGDLKYTFSQTGDAYYIVVPSGSATPSNAEIKAQANYGSVTVSTRGSSPISANVERVFAVTGLNPASDYTAYIVTEYDNSGTATFSAQQSVTFSTKPGVPTLVSADPDAGKVSVTLTPFSSETNFEYSTDGGTSWVARNPASVSGTWEITGLTNGTAYNFQFRSVFRTLRSDSTAVTTVTPSVAPAYLSSLRLSEGILTPTFTANTLNYQASVSSSVDEITITPTSTGNSITVAGRDVVSGATSQTLRLQVGINEITVSVLRPVVGASATVYTLQVTRQTASTPSSGSASPTPTPTPTATPTPRPRPRVTPSPRPSIIIPNPSPTPLDSAGPVPTSSPTPRLIAVVVPERAPTPNVVYTPTNPIPEELVDVLFSPLAYVTQESSSPSLPALNPTQSLAFENGSPIDVVLQVTNNQNGYLLQGGTWQVALEATDTNGTPLALDDYGNIILNPDRFVEFQGTGFAPGSIIKVWLFSDPASLADVRADANGTFTGRAQLPVEIPEGQHTVQLNGLSQNGTVRSVSLGVIVQPEALPAPTFETVAFSPLWNLALVTAGVVLMFLLVLMARRRWFLILAKRRKQKEKGTNLQVDQIDPWLAAQVSDAKVIQQFPVDSRRKLGRGAPPNKRSNSPFRPKDQ